VDEDPRAWVCKCLEAPASPLCLGHDRGAEPEPVEGRSDDAERKDLGKRRFRFDAQETADLTAWRIDDREVKVAIDPRRRPATAQPVGVDDGRAEPCHALFVRKGGDLVRVLVLRWPHPETG
jgi:hypothetical protein